MPLELLHKEPSTLERRTLDELEGRLREIRDLLRGARMRGLERCVELTTEFPAYEPVTACSSAE